MGVLLKNAYGFDLRDGILSGMGLKKESIKEAKSYYNNQGKWTLETLNILADKIGLVGLDGDYNKDGLVVLQSFGYSKKKGYYTKKGYQIQYNLPSKSVSGCMIEVGTLKEAAEVIYNEFLTIY